MVFSEAVWSMDIFISTPRHHFYFYNIPGQGSENAMVETGGLLEEMELVWREKVVSLPSN